MQKDLLVKKSEDFILLCLITIMTDYINIFINIILILMTKLTLLFKKKQNVVLYVSVFKLY